MNSHAARWIPGREMSRRHFLTTLTAGAGVAVLAACGGSGATATPSAPTSIPTPPTATKASVSTLPAAGSVTSGAQSAMPSLVIEAVEYGFRTNGSIPAGMTMVQMKNLGQEDHQTQFLRLNDGVTLPQLQATFQKDQHEGEKLATLVGGPGTAAAGGMSTAMLDLQAGQYLLACFIPGRDGISHAAKGMVLPLQVTAQTGAAAPAPATQGTVAMKEFSFALSTSTLPVGRSMVAVVNEGAQSHEFGLLRLAPGKTAADVTHYFATPPTGPPPFSAAGGLTALSPGQRGIAALDLTPGNYAAICFLPDAASGKQHLQLGMVAGITVM